MRSFAFQTAALAALLFVSCSQERQMRAMEEGFAEPPREVRPMTWWHWMGGNVTKDGIRKDLEWMHASGLSGFFLFDAAISTPAIVPERLVYMSDGWKDALAYALDLADSLGLEVGIASSPGWSLTGGPWVSEDDAQKKLIWSMQPVTGHFCGQLPEPYRTVSCEFYKSYSESDGIVRGYLKDICVLAVRDSSEVIDISDNFTDGRLDWTAPAGLWKVYRFAYTMIGHVNGPASLEATGLEVDKLDAGAVSRYWEMYLGMWRDASGRNFGPGGIVNVNIDSYESGRGTWTPLFEAEFEARRGYSVRKWLPVLAGETIGDSIRRSAFIFDWNRTMGELLAENHYDLATEILHKHGLRRYSEAHEERRAFIGDGMMVKRSADVPMSAFWMRKRSGFYATMPHMEADIRESASVAHIYGQNVCAAESFTTNGLPGKWDGWWAYQCHPGMLKPYADAAMAEGLNKFVIHSSVHQPDDVHVPGLGLGSYGQWFIRHETWAGEARAWVDYLSRSSFMLRQGRFVADILYLYGEENNLTRRFHVERTPVPSGWNFDFANADVLLNAVRIENGALVTDSGMRYRMLVIDNLVGNMSEELARQINSIARAGIPVCDLRGSVPVRVPLPENGNPENYPAPDTSMASPSPEGVSLISTLLANNDIAPDVENLPDSCAFVHRSMPHGDIYWIANICSKPRELDLLLRASGKHASVWHADSGIIEKLPFSIVDGRARVHLAMNRDDAVFVVISSVLPKHASEPLHLPDKPLISLKGPWKLHFSGATAPEDTELQRLLRLDLSNNPALRYFSGSITYSTVFDYDGSGRASLLSLGKVWNMARVTLNGKDLGLLWKEPYVVDVSDAMVKGDNTLEIKVINSWANRLVGDSTFPENQRVAWTSFKFYSPEDPIPPSGLEGPVQIL